MIALDTPSEDTIAPYQIVDITYIGSNGHYTKRTVTIPKGILALTRTTTCTYNYTPQIYVKFGLTYGFNYKKI